MSPENMFEPQLPAHAWDQSPATIYLLPARQPTTHQTYHHGMDSNLKIANANVCATGTAGVGIPMVSLSLSLLACSHIPRGGAVG